MREYVCFHLPNKKRWTSWIRTLWKICAVSQCIRTHLRCNVCTGIISCYFFKHDTLIFFNCSNIFLFHCSLSNLLNDFLVSSQSLAISSSNCSSGRVDGMQWEILLLMAQNDTILVYAFLPLVRECFLWRSYFVPRHVPQKQETIVSLQWKQMMKWPDENKY